MFISIDEYDNFANQMIVSRDQPLYDHLTASKGFFKRFFKALKAGKGLGAINRIFITGVLPVLIDELASGYNIADFITLKEDFEAMVGFTQAEVDNLLDQIYVDYDLAPETRNQVEAVIKDNYNGYHFTESKVEALYNTTILIYFLQNLHNSKQIPRYLIDTNLKTDLSWVKRLTASNPKHAMELVDRLTMEGRLPYNASYLLEKFSVSQFFDKDFYPVSFFYLGMLTRGERGYMRLPNLNMKTIFSDYFNSLHALDTGTLYSEMMADFAQNPDLPKLFSEYWRLYVSQLPEAVFQKVNENFYRTTFYDLCRQYLGDLYVWSMEHSLASGRTDLEMAGQFHTKFAGMRYLMEFKYISNAQARRRDIDPATFEARKDDLAQLAAYTTECRRLCPKETISAWLIYCFGNRACRIFPMPG